MLVRTWHGMPMPVPQSLYLEKPPALAFPFSDWVRKGFAEHFHPF
jgi:hypothetical protein